MEGAGFAPYIDHTLLAADATSGRISALCAEALEHRFATVCVNPRWVPLAASILRGAGPGVCAVVGFPLGANATGTKVAEAITAIGGGASELDMVMDIGAAKDGDWEAVRRDIAEVAMAAHDRSAILKVILETCLLSEDEIRRACEAAVAAGADFLKTSTGFASGGATEAHVRLLAACAAGRARVKASGGIRDAAAAKAMIAAGAVRLGTSAGVAIVGGGGPRPAAAAY